MVRQVIVDEATDIHPEIFIAKDAVWWEPGDFIPITDSQFKVIGQADDIQRDGNTVTAEVNVPFPKTYQCTFYLTDIESHVFEGVRFVTRGRLREVNVFDITPPEMPHEVNPNGEEA